MSASREAARRAETLSTHSAQPQDQAHAPHKVFRVLSIDGGGIKGIIPGRVLEDIERRTGKPISESFDLIVGTSIGGIMALALTAPDPLDPKSPRYTAADVTRMLTEHGQEVFPKGFLKGVRQVFEEKYSAEPLDALMAQYFEDAKVSQSTTNVMVTAYDIERRQTVFLKHREGHYKAPSDPDFYMRDAARATASAPTYFEPVKIVSLPSPDGSRGAETMSLVDGGVFAVNPALSAFIEGLKLKPENAEMMVVSLGTGDSAKPFAHDDAKGWGIFGWMNPANDVPLLSAMMDGQSDAADHHLKMMLGNRYFRIDAKLDEAHGGPKEAMDNATAGNIAKLKAFGDEIVRANAPALAQIAQILKSDTVPAQRFDRKDTSPINVRRATAALA